MKSSKHDLSPVATAAPDRQRYASAAGPVNRHHRPGFGVDAIRCGFVDRRAAGFAGAGGTAVTSLAFEPQALTALDTVLAHLAPQVPTAQRMVAMVAMVDGASALDMLGDQLSQLQAELSRREALLAQVTSEALQQQQRFLRAKHSGG